MTQTQAHAEQVRRRWLLSAGRSLDYEPKLCAEFKRRCGSGESRPLSTCPKCVRRHRTWLTGGALRLFEDEPDPILANGIPTRGTVPRANESPRPTGKRRCNGPNTPAAGGEDHPADRRQ